MCAIDGGACASVVVAMGTWQSLTTIISAEWAQWWTRYKVWRESRLLRCRHDGGLTTQVGGGIGKIVCIDCGCTLLTSAELPDDWETTKGRLGL